MKLRFEKLKAYSYVEEGLISISDFGEGRLIPSIVLDIKENQDIIDLFKIHNTIGSGTFSMSWSQDFLDRSFCSFKISFTKPMIITFSIGFNIEKDFAIIDGILQSQGLFLQLGKKGDKISSKINDEKMLIEIPEMGIKNIWDNILRKNLIKKHRIKGYSKIESKEIAQQHIASIREIWKHRRNDIKSNPK